MNEHEIISNPQLQPITPKSIYETMKGFICKLTPQPIIILEHADGKTPEEEEILGFATICNAGDPIMSPSLDEIYMTIFPVTLKRQLFIVLKDGKLNIGGKVYDPNSEEEIQDVHPILKMFTDGERVVSVKR